MRSEQSENSVRPLCVLYWVCLNCNSTGCLCQFGKHVGSLHSMSGLVAIIQVCLADRASSSDFKSIVATFH